MGADRNNAPRFIVASDGTATDRKQAAASDALYGAWVARNLFARPRL